MAADSESVCNPDNVSQSKPAEPECNSTEADLTLGDLLKFKVADPVTETYSLEMNWRLFQARYDYAWSYFEFHANQRITIFNFFIVFAGLVLTARATLQESLGFKAHRDAYALG